VVRGILVSDKDKEKAQKLLAGLPEFEGRDLISEVTTKKPYSWPLEKSGTQGPKSKFRVVAVDFGVKWNLLRDLESRGCAVEVVPATTTAAEILARKPQGVFLSNGPGDPSAAPYAVEMTRGILGKVPIFGVCMGHQILSLALGGKTFKMKFGHRGGNQPVLEKSRGAVEISSHNHGYAVDPKTLPASVQVTHVNLNDQACEGIAAPEKKAFSVQYHPEACPGPHDSVHLFDRFIKMMS
jgi:carbamoyl-phosphate synthase small subunit